MATAACSNGRGPDIAAEPPVLITVLHTNDEHGHFWTGEGDQYGLALRKTIVDGVRREVAAIGGHILLLDAGDVNTGVPESDLQQAEPDFRGMSALGYDAMAVGNHEFDPPAQVQERQRREWSAFPWLSANVYRDGTRHGTRMFEPHKLFAIGRARVAVLGLTTDDTAKMGTEARYPAVSFADPIAEAGRLVPSLRRQADMVIVLSHMGHYVDGVHGVSAPGDVELARAVPGIDLIVGGHTHSLVCMVRPNVRVVDYQAGQPCTPDRQSGTWIVQAGDRGRYVGRADFEVRPGGSVRLLRYRLLPVVQRQGASAAGDAEMTTLLRPFQQRGETNLLVEVGRTEGRFDGDRAQVRHHATTLGTLITTAMMDSTGADVALVSSGGIRDSLPDGRLALRDLLQAQPFGNRIVVVTMRGTELEHYLAIAAAMTPGSGAYAQVSGARMSANTASRETREFLIKGQRIDGGGRYRLALNSFVSGGGDGYPDLSRHPGLETTGLTDISMLQAFISKHGVIRAKEFEPTLGAWPPSASNP